MLQVIKQIYVEEAHCYSEGQDQRNLWDHVDRPVLSQSVG